MSVLSGIGRFFSTSAPAVNGSSVDYRPGLRSSTRPHELAYRDICEVLRAFYYSNGLYETLRAVRFGLTANAPHLKPIRNPVPAVVDFWGAHGFPKPLQLTTPAMQQRPEGEEAQQADDPLALAIEQVWTWSNWQRRMPECARFVGLYGEAYLKVTADQQRGRVWFELLEPCYVWDYEADERDYLTWIRLDVPKCETDYETGTVRRYTRTEVWSKDDNSYRIWETEGDAYGRPLNSLGATIPDGEGTLSELGIDFIPFVRIPFRELGDKRGLGAIQIAVESVIEADLSATNLHEMLYQDAEGAWVLKAVGLDANNRPLPPPVVSTAQNVTDAFGRLIQGTGASDNTVQVGKRSFWRLGGNQELQSVIPAVDYDAALAILQDHDSHLEKLMPALTYAKISELTGADLSGRAIRFKLTAAIDQVEEVRANLLAGLKQADMMALTLGQVNGIFDAGLGSFDKGSFEHGFVEQEVLPVSDFEEAQTRQAEASAMQSEQAAGLPLAEILRRAGYSDDQIVRVLDQQSQQVEQETAQQQAVAQAMGEQQQAQQPPGGQR